MVRVLLALFFVAPALAFAPSKPIHHDASVVCHAEKPSSFRSLALAFAPSKPHRASVVCHAKHQPNNDSSRRSFFSTWAALLVAGATALATKPSPAQAVGPVRIDLKNPTYTAIPCPKEKPIPGQMAMRGLKGMCVTVDADLADAAPKELEKVGVYGFVTDADTGESVLANNPDLSTDAGQFTLVELITPKDKKIQFEFVAAIDPKKDLSQYENGIGPLSFESLRVISYPGGQQYGAISPCEMNEFSSECEEWEAENGPYVKGDFMVRSNPRTKGR